MTFADRFDAGRQLAARLRTHRIDRPIVVGLARGGVPVAFEVARGLDAPLEVWIARKIHAPLDPDVTMGAVSEDGAVSLDQALVSRLALPELVVALQVVRGAAEIGRQACVMRGGPRLDVRGRVVIVVDDGVATGATVRAAAGSILARRPAAVVLAVPFGRREVIEELRPGFDCVVCIRTEPAPAAIESTYRDFWSVSEADVASLMTEHERARGGEFEFEFESALQH